jgi:hypothetical protein
MGMMRKRASTDPFGAGPNTGGSDLFARARRLLATSLDAAKAPLRLILLLNCRNGGTSPAAQRFCPWAAAESA